MGVGEDMFGKSIIDVAEERQRIRLELTNLGIPPRTLIDNT
jgi:hypothetical protein